MARFLSAVAYETREAVEIQTGGGAGVPAEFDPPVATALRRLGDRLQPGPAEVVVVADDRLRIVLGYYREGLGTESPYFKFLAFWNALEVAGEDLTAGLAKWIRATITPHSGHGRHADPPPSDWWERLQNERRHNGIRCKGSPFWGANPYSGMALSAASTPSVRRVAGRARAEARVGSGGSYAWQ
jgi:hypothetical protein